MLRRKSSLRESYAQKLRQAGMFTKTPLRTFLKRGKPLKKISRSQRARMARYHEVRNEYLRTHPVCGICLVRNQKPAPATEVHHIYGRNGSLLCDERGFCPSCFNCRLWPHENPVEARAAGVLGEAWQWGVPIDRHRKESYAIA